MTAWNLEGGAEKHRTKIEKIKLFYSTENVKYRELKAQKKTHDMLTNVTKRDILQRIFHYSTTLNIHKQKIKIL